MDISQVGQKIREYRLKHRMTQEKFAARSFLSSSYISKLELGKVKNPTKETLEYIADTIGITFSELVSIMPLHDQPTANEDHLQNLKYIEYKQAWDKLSDEEKATALRVIRILLKME